MPLLKYLVAAGVIVAAGVVGYRYSQQHPFSVSSIPSIVSSSTIQHLVTSSTAFTPPTIDSTWQTYQNGTLKFLLNYPTKGAYAPKFSVKVISATDAHVKDGCYDEFTDGTVNHINLNGTDFCRVTHVANPPSIAVDTEFWSTKKDNRLAVITFTKKYSTATTTGATFDVDAYRQFVGGLMSTFHYPTTTQP